MDDLPTRLFRIRDEGISCTLADRALIRACYRCYASEGKDVARWVATQLAEQIETIRIVNQEDSLWRKDRLKAFEGSTKKEARRG